MSLPLVVAGDNYKEMNDLSKDAANHLAVDEAGAGQRVDNFLLRVLKGVPKSHIYRILRSGEVRVNRKRVQPDARLAARRRPAHPAGAHRRRDQGAARRRARSPCRSSTRTRR